MRMFVGVMSATSGIGCIYGLIPKRSLDRKERFEKIGIKSNDDLGLMMRKGG